MRIPWGISLTAEGGDVFRLEVHDTGMRILPEGRERLFVEFQQLALPPSSRQRQGTSLGLAQTKCIVEAQGGSVGVYSVLGEGSSYGPSLMVARCTDSNK